MPILHPIDPIYNEDCRILILGSFPSVKSRENAFFYSHPQNRFWKVLCAVLQEPLAETTEEKKELLLRHHIALWDVIASCDITGSADSTIQNVIPNDLSPIIKASPDIKIFTNGTVAHRYYRRYMENPMGRQAIALPSTSPANAASTLSKLIAAWQVIGQYL